MFQNGTVFWLLIAFFALSGCDNNNNGFGFGTSPGTGPGARTSPGTGPGAGTGTSPGTGPGAGTGAGATNPCAGYTKNNSSFSGALAEGHCLYTSAFVDSNNPLTSSVTLKKLPNNGAHVFAGSLFMGTPYNTDAELAAAGIAKGGDGPTLIVEAGAIVAFQDRSQFLVINRGSQIIAKGTRANPITFTARTDLQGGLSNMPLAVQQWGGIVINGFGVTNQCAYTGARTFRDDVIVARNTLALSSPCHVASEGSAGADENFHGGNNNADDSGILDYVIIKHTGAEVGSGDELNGITLAAVGRATRLSNLQIFSAYDDGIEIFGGALDIENLFIANVRDDAIDLDDGYVGTITNALIYQPPTDGNHCLEADGLSNYSKRSPLARMRLVTMQGLNTRAKIRGLTCILTPNGDSTGTHGPGAGLRLREGLHVFIENALIIGSLSANDPANDDDNACVRATEIGAAAFTRVTIRAAIFACAEHVTTAAVARNQASVTFESGVLYQAVMSEATLSPIAAMNAEFQVLMAGTPPAISLPVATSMVNDAPVGAMIRPPPAAAGDTAPDFIGALGTSGTNPFAGWVFGFFETMAPNP